ncbi:uncharacterized protein LOC133206048 [Saccostrea echinata]|uniref:uncharacterized protein LOC133206048 n=1 Tax=Saccostrea echinata TaxID=191078 RepID=UPI002A821232|nr:uncharacterized protein LOC133206048 [Saccostrea echinata]
MEYLIFCVLLILYCCKQSWSTRITAFEYRRRCPNTEEKWRQREEGYICPATTKYHCILTEDGNIVEFCNDIIWIEEDYCPMLNLKTGNIDVRLCPENAVCPSGHYLSSTVYKYPACLQRKTDFTTHTPRKTVTSLNLEAHNSPETTDDAENNLNVITLLVSIGIILTACISVVVLAHVRGQKENALRDKTATKENV